MLFCTDACSGGGGAGGSYVEHVCVSVINKKQITSNNVCSFDYSISTCVGFPDKLPLLQ